MLDGSENFYDVSAILAGETMIPAIVRKGVKGLGPALDPSCCGRDLPAGSQLDLPMWLLPTMAARTSAHVMLPRFYGEKMRRKLQAGAQCEDLRSRCLYFYDVAAALNAIVHQPALGHLAMLAFRGRYKELLTKAHSSTEGPALTKLRSKLSAEEAVLFAAGAASVAAFERYRYSTSTAIRGPQKPFASQSKARMGPMRPALADMSNQAVNAQRPGASRR